MGEMAELRSVVSAMQKDLEDSSVSGGVSGVASDADLEAEKVRISQMADGPAKAAAEGALVEATRVHDAHEAAVAGAAAAAANVKAEEVRVAAMVAGAARDAAEAHLADLRKAAAERAAEADAVVVGDGGSGGLHEEMSTLMGEVAELRRVVSAIVCAWI